MIQGSIKRAFTYMESGPVILVTTNDGKKDNVMTISWHMVMDFRPHIAISTGPWNESFQTILDTKECVINIPSVDRAEDVIKAGTINGSEADKFELLHFQKQKGVCTKAPLITDSIASLECRLVDYVAEHGLLILEAVCLWENPEKTETRTFHANGDGTFFADGEFFNYRESMRKWVPSGCERL